MKLYTGNRGHIPYHEGQVLGLLHEREIRELYPTLPVGTPGNDLAEHGGWVFPEGMGVYGYFQLHLKSDPTRWQPPIPHTFVNYAMELARRAHYPHLPSRYQAIYAAETIEDARLYADDVLIGTNGRSVPIFEIEVQPERVHRGDTSIFHYLEDTPPLGGKDKFSMAAKSMLMHAYWQGAWLDGPGSCWEYIVGLPVTLGRQVATVNLVNGLVLTAIPDDDVIAAGAG